jgi:hypothetical protein
VILLLLACAESPPRGCRPLTLTRGQDLGPDDLIAEAAEWQPSVTGPGVAVADLNGDGWLDVAVATGTGSTRLLLNDGTGTLVPGDVALPLAISIAAADVSGDGLPDLFLGGGEGRDDLIATADGRGGYQTASLPDSAGHSTTGSFADADGDGDLDLMVARYVAWPEYEDVLAGTLIGGGNVLYENTGGTFTATDAIPAQHIGDVSHIAQWLDVEGDGDLDLYLANDFGMYLTPNQLLRNDGTGGLSVDEGCGCQLAMEAMGVAVGELGGGTGLPDLFITDIGGSHLLRADGEGGYFDASHAAGVHIPLQADHMVAWGTAAVDLDGDTHADLPMVFGALNFWDPDEQARFWDEDGEEWLDGMAQEDVLLVSQGDGTFADLSAAAGFADDDVGRGLAVGDLNRDGRPDLVTIGWRGEGDPYVRTWIAGGGCGPGVTVEAPIGAGAVLDTEHGTTRAWQLPATTFSASAPELYLGMGAATTGTLTMDGTSISVRAGDRISR